MQQIPPQGLRTPEKSYPLRQKENGSIQVEWTPTSNRFLGKRIVYRIKNLVSFKRYIGQTSQLFRRISSHISRSQTRPDSPFMHDLKEHPEDFSIGVFETDDPDELESTLIEALDTKRSGYNRRGGGGGGTERKDPPASPTTVRLAKTFFQKTYQSPTKFPLTGGSPEREIPASIREKEGIIYRIQRKTARGTWIYVGCTERKSVRRLCEHLFCARNPSTVKGKKRRFYRDMNRHLDQCSFSVIDDSFFLKGLSLSQKEQLVIEFYKKAGYLLYNANKGGGGGSSKK